MVHGLEQACKGTSQIRASLVRGHSSLLKVPAAVEISADALTAMRRGPDVGAQAAIVFAIASVSKTHFDEDVQQPSHDADVRPTVQVNAGVGDATSMESGASQASGGAARQLAAPAVNCGAAAPEPHSLPSAHKLWKESRQSNSSRQKGLAVQVWVKAEAVAQKPGVQAAAAVLAVTAFTLVTGRASNQR
ncbi:hypothetical protein ABBQ38_007005 [Trebouxia sp. C0009 RCD-2024]